MIKLCRQEGLETVNIVRKDEYVKDLRESYGEKYVLNQESPTFLKDLEPILKDTQATILFECLGGDLPGDIFAKMVSKSWMIVYGSLTKKRSTFDAYDFRWNDKNITSFILNRWIVSLEPEVRQQQFQRVADDLQNNQGHIFGSQIVKEVPLEDWKEAMEESEKLASEGKFIIKCHRN
ncbi:zinc-binding dehydrogenase family protein [Stylonychia lemnae]|uniref:Zinc-binding dehydrogenase family protein n=1 Tax=Stylonychia lemnae TaxID=5949 RepID=A0A077ZT26_STYLE|nr:zinc-binding dehydrogenase family protein [Stylonychia lemnae]|eukprot:CDW73037.1 zinc-binding dehydrogenase family protein [Stylonychia lemnae]